jgi:heat shock protein HslJ
MVVGSSVTAHFEGGRVYGSDGCNRYSAPYTATATTLEVGPAAASTRMACAQPLMDQAEAFMRALTQARAYRIQSGQLELLSADGEVLASHVPQPQTLAGTSWHVTGYNNGHEAVVSVVASANVTMTFSTDGKVSGSAGCNRYTAPYVSDGPKLTFGAIAATRRMCTQPDGVMEQEQQFLKALEAVTSAGVDGDRLELRTAKGQLAATLARDWSR